MKFEVSSLDLKKGLGVAFKGISSRPHLPILSGILILVEKGKTSLVSTDLEISFWMEIETSISEDGSVVVPAKLFLDFVSTLDDGRVSIESDGQKLKIVSKGLETEIVCQPSEDYPVVPKSSGKGIELKTSVFKEKVEKVIVSVAKDEVRPILTGILFKFKNKELAMIATDGFRLALNVMEISGIENEENVVIPARSIFELQKVLIETASDKFFVEVDKQSKQVIFVAKGMEMSTRLLDGEFPPYQQIIPNTYITKVSVNKHSLISAVKRASLFSKDNANVVKIETKDRLFVSAESSQIGSNTTDLEAEIDGDSLNVVFNARYLLDFLPVIDNELVEWETEGELKPSVFRDGSDSGWLQVVMPIRTQS